MSTFEICTTKGETIKFAPTAINAKVSKPNLVIYGKVQGKTALLYLGLYGGVMKLEVKSNFGNPSWWFDITPIF